MVECEQAVEAALQGDNGVGREDHQVARENGEGGRAEPVKDIEDLAGIIRLTGKKLFPWFNEELGKTVDPRRDHPSKIYPLTYLIWMVMLMFVTQSGSRRQYDFDKDTEAFLLNLLVLSGAAGAGITTMAKAETADDLLQKIDPAVFHSLRRMMVYALIRCKRLNPCKYDNCWRLVADGTGLYTYKKRHCPYCLTKKNSKTGEITYYHNVLEFKLVSPDGFAISLDSEFIINKESEACLDGDDAVADGAEANRDDEVFKDKAEKVKQDCETKAFHRAAKRIKEEWPHMRFLLLGDAIFANAKIMALCRRYSWHYCLSLKDNLPKFKAEAEASLAKAKPTLHVPESGVTQKLRCVEDLSHRGILNHVLSCEETVTVKDGTTGTTRFLWVTDLRPTHEGLAKLANKAGRQRWKIENQGFNTQKNNGYNIEHGYGVKGHAWENYYLIAQIVHIIAQMATRTDAIHKLPSRRMAKRAGSPRPLLELFGSMKNFVKRLAEAFRYCPPTWRDIVELGDFQLRHLYST